MKQGLGGAPWQIVESRTTADQFIQAHDWIAFNGGCARRVAHYQIGNAPIAVWNAIAQLSALLDLADSADLAFAALAKALADIGINYGVPTP